MERSIRDKVKNRVRCNEALIDILQVISKEFPDLRFHQILYVFDFIDPKKGDQFSEEPEDTLKRVLASVHKQLSENFSSEEVKMFLKKYLSLGIEIETKTK